MSEIETRAAHTDDVPDIARMLTAMLGDMAAHGGDQVADEHTRIVFFTEQVASDLDREAFRHLIALEPGGGAVGTASAEVVAVPEVFAPHDVLHISTVYVEPMHRDRGIGRGLIEMLLAWGRSRGCTLADLNVLAGSPARTLYERLGFEDVRSRMTLSLAGVGTSAPDRRTTNVLTGYRSRAARALVLLHEEHLRAFIPVWRAAKRAGVTLDVPDHASYQSLEHLLVHVLGAARHYMEWITQKLDLPHPGITPVPGIAVLETALDDYVAHLLARWRVPLRDVADERLEDIEHQAAWGQSFTIDGMLEHAAMHPMRHGFQLSELTAETA